MIFCLSLNVSKAIKVGKNIGGKPGGVPGLSVGGFCFRSVANGKR